MLFTDRPEAGRRLAESLRSFRAQRPVVLALPRGGVPVGFEIARALAAPLDLILVRKIGAPDQPELAIGAVADGPEPELVTDPRLMAALGVSDAFVQDAKTAALKEIERRRATYLKDRPPVPVRGRPAIVVDDGIATGATMQAALRVTRRRAPARLVLAVPVAPPSAISRMRRLVDEVVCLETPQDFYAVGQFYREFPQLSDQEVVDLLEQAASLAAPN